MAPFMGLKGSCSPFINLVFHDDFFTIFYTTTEGWFPVEFCSSLLLLLLYICFCSLLINTRLVFISHFVSDPLRKGYRVLEYQCCLFVCTCFVCTFSENTLRVHWEYICHTVHNFSSYELSSKEEEALPFGLGEDIPSVCNRKKLLIEFEMFY